MDLSPQRVRGAEFKTVKRGLDPEEVQAFLNDVADELENAQNQSTAMEARARAAVARLQELSDGAESQAAATTSDESIANVDQAETISRTLLLAQRTADTTIAQAEAESERVLAAATEEAAATLDSTREMAARLIDEAREEARKVGEAERVAVSSEVSSLKARRDFLESDVDHLEQFLVSQRERLRDAADAMVELSERVPNGLGEVRRPLVSAADDEDPAGHGIDDVASGAGAGQTADAESVVDAGGPGDIGGTADTADTADAAGHPEYAEPDHGGEPEELVIQTDVADRLDPADESSADAGAEPEASGHRPFNDGIDVPAEASPAFGIAAATDQVDRSDADEASNGAAQFSFDDRA